MLGLERKRLSPHKRAVRNDTSLGTSLLCRAGLTILTESRPVNKGRSTQGLQRPVQWGTCLTDGETRSCIFAPAVVDSRSKFGGWEGGGARWKDEQYHRGFRLGKPTSRWTSTRPSPLVVATIAAAFCSDRCCSATDGICLCGRMLSSFGTLRTAESVPCPLATIPPGGFDVVSTVHGIRGHQLLSDRQRELHPKAADAIPNGQ